MIQGVAFIFWVIVHYILEASSLVFDAKITQLYVLSRNKVYLNSL